MNAPFEITQLAAKDTFELELNNANGEPMFAAEGQRISVTVYGPGSKQHQAAQARRNQRIMDRMAKRGKAKLSAEEQRIEQAEYLGACTKSFNHWAYKGNADQGAIVAAFADPTIGFIADQVSAAIGDWANFSSSSPTS